MLLLNLIVFLICVKKSYHFQYYRGIKFSARDNAGKAPHRILELMRSYYEEANVRITELNEMRFMYEESPHYEQGYVIGEIIERYRKVVEHVKRPRTFKSDHVYSILKRVELTQKLYFEIYHLVRMMHETNQKYKYVLEFGADGDSGMGLQELWAAQKHLALMAQRRRKAKKRRLKANEKLRQMYMKGLSQSVYGSKRKPYNKWWPIDYGWEISEEWW